MIDSRDTAMRLAAAEHVRRIAVSDVFTGEQLAAGFVFEGERIPLVNPQRGIFKPRAMTHLLSVKTVYPRIGARVWYDDQRVVHLQISSGQELVDYAFMGADADAADNRWMRLAYKARVPILYFLGVAPGRYTAVWPTYVVEWAPNELKVRLAFGQSVDDALPDAPERRYAARLGDRLITFQPDTD